MEDKVCYIMGAGKYLGESFFPKPEDYVIAADGGLKYLQEIGINADLVVGDFDSLGCVPEHPNVIKHPAVKDDTDMLLAVKKGLCMGYDKFVLLGALGNRIDHSIANIQIMVYLARRGARGYLVGGGFVSTAISNGSIRFSSDAKGIISVFSQSEMSLGVNISGLKYHLENATITNDMPIGISNEFTGRRALISVENGTLMILWNGGLEFLEEL